jgi:putative flavoprotein involved in K+ transport
MGFPTKDEVADYLEAYANRFSLPVHLQMQVHKLERTNQGFQASTNHGAYLAQQVIIATGPFQKPFIPKLQGMVSEEVFQIHSDVYRAPEDLKEGPVLVVGGGNTGVQLAIELSSDREVYLALGEDRKFLPLEFMTKNIFWWFDKLGVLDASIETKLGSWLSKQKDPIFGLGPQLTLLVNHGKIKRMPKLIGFDGKEAIFRGGERATISNILWSTGFTYDYSWIEIPGVLDAKGNVIHHRGVSPIPGLYFLGLPWQYRRGSALIGGVGRDARYLIDQIIQVNHNKISLLNLLLK